MLTESITLKTHDNLSNEPLYLCSWNNNEIVQIHSKETLEKEYKETNLFEDDEKHFSSFSNGFKNYFFTIQKYLEESEDLDFLNVPFICDNMEITRIT
jgi:hypothetical protein